MRVYTCVCRACGTIRREQTHAYIGCVHEIYRLETQSRLDG